jgi:uncharacterized protein
MAAAAPIFRGAIVQFYRSKFFLLLDDRGTVIATVIFGGVLGILVTISSVGAGAIGVCSLIILYPQLSMAKIVGSDVALRRLLTLVAGAGHWMIGTVDVKIVGSLLIGSLPGIITGSYFAVRVPERVLRLLLAAVLVIIAGRPLFDHVTAGGSFLTARTGRSQ